MNKLKRPPSSLNSRYPDRILQFGGGNFLRGFVDWIIEVYNDTYAVTDESKGLGVLVVKPTENGDYKPWKSQDGLFHVLTKGIENGQLIDEYKLINCVNRIIHPYKEWPEFIKSAENLATRFVISNTTENGIKTNAADQLSDTPPHEFPAKLTVWLYHRYQFFDGKKEAGCVMIPTELLINNGVLLKKCVLEYAIRWKLAEGFVQWIEVANTFCNTLVDRIIPGVNKSNLSETFEQIGCEDAMVTQGEPYHLFAIEAPLSVRKELPLDQIGLNIIYTDDLTPYRTRKVKILNGAHTSLVPVGYLYGITTVREAVEHEVMGEFIQATIFNEIIPTLDLPEKELKQFANDVLDRFKNPFIDHHLISISLNSFSKYKVRILPSILNYHQRKGRLPNRLVFSMAAMIHFYKGAFNGKLIPLNDDPEVLQYLKSVWNKFDGSYSSMRSLAKSILVWEKIWSQDLSKIEGFEEKLTAYLLNIENIGIEKSIKAL